MVKNFICYLPGTAVLSPISVFALVQRYIKYFGHVDIIPETMKGFYFVSVNLIWRTSSTTCTTSLVEVEQVQGKDTPTKDEIVGKGNAKSDWNYHGLSKK